MINVNNLFDCASKIIEENKQKEDARRSLRLVNNIRSVRNIKDFNRFPIDDSAFVYVSDYEVGLNIVKNVSLTFSVQSETIYINPLVCFCEHGGLGRCECGFIDSAECDGFKYDFIELPQAILKLKDFVKV